MELLRQQPELDGCIKLGWKLGNSCYQLCILFFLPPLIAEAFVNGNWVLNVFFKRPDGFKLFCWNEKMRDVMKIKFNEPYILKHFTVGLSTLEKDTPFNTKS